MSIRQSMMALLVTGFVALASADTDPGSLGNVAATAAQPDGNIIVQAATARLLSTAEEGSVSVRPPRLLPVRDRYGFEGTQAAVLSTAVPSRLVWKIKVTAAGEYDVLLVYGGAREAFAEVEVGDVRLRKERFGTTRERSIQALGRMTLPQGTQRVTFSFGRLSSSTETRNMSLLVQALILSPAVTGLAAKPERELCEYLLPIVDRKPVPGLILPGIVSDHMVLQRDMPVPFWGLAKPGDTVTVTFGNRSKSATPDPFGRWVLRLDPLAVSAEPRSMTVSAGEQTVTFSDVLVGDVWLGSGQSNMEIGVDAPPKWPRHTGAEALIGDRDFPLLRISSTCPRYFKTPNGGWVPATHDNIFQTSAMMVCAMVPLQEKLGIPVGVIVRALSSSPSGAWLDPDAESADPAMRTQIADYAAGGYDQAWAAAVEKCRAQEKVPAIPYTAPPWPGLSSWRTDGTGALWQKLIEPIVPYAIKGVVWDQGESGTDIGGTTHAVVQPVLIRSWRQAWGQGDFPFVHVQKREYDAAALAAIAAVPSTSMVSNQGLDQRLHPVDKEKYGARVCKMILESVHVE